MRCMFHVPFALVLLLGCDADHGYEDDDDASPATTSDTTFFSDMEAAATDTAPLDTMPAMCAPEPETSCDGEDACFRWSMRQIDVPPEGVARITWRLEHFCEATLDEARFGFAPKVVALAPEDFATYTSPEGSVWTVAHDDTGCGGFRFVRRSGAEPGSYTTFVLELATDSITLDTSFVNQAKAGDTTGTFATGASSCFVLTSP